MGLCRKVRKARVKARAEVKAAKVRAKKEVKEAAKLEYRRDKLLAKQEKALLKADRKGLKAKHKHERKRAKQELARIKSGRMTVGTAKRYAGVARVAAPLLIPLVYRGITAAREQLIQQRSQKIGVSADELAKFNGHGAPIKARIAGISDRVHAAPSLPKGFVLDVDKRLKELDAAVDNAEYMTIQQRRRSHSTINRDLDAVLAEVQAKINEG